jgi:HSP20 family protein
LTDGESIRTESHPKEEKAMLNAVTRWNPETSYLTFRQPLFKLLDSVLADPQGSEDITTRGWLPPVDIQETEDAYRLHAELPGLSKDDIQITLENNVLRLSGERRWERDVKKDSFQRVERTYGTFARSFTLPSEVKAEAVLAAFENGVLTITVPKAEAAKPRKIEIS